MPSQCRQPFTDLKILMDGSVFACAGGQYIGNLKKNTASELWNSEKILKIRRQLSEDDYDETCINCNLYDNKNKRKKNNVFVNAENYFRGIRKINNNYLYKNDQLINYNNAYGFIDQIIRTRLTFTIEGWAIDRVENIPAGYAVLFVNGKFEAFTSIKNKRNDVVIAMNNTNLLECGFKLNLGIISLEKKISLVVFDKNLRLIGNIYNS